MHFFGLSRCRTGAEVAAGESGVRVPDVALAGAWSQRKRRDGRGRRLARHRSSVLVSGTGQTICFPNSATRGAQGKAAIPFEERQGLIWAFPAREGSADPYQRVDRRVGRRIAWFGPLAQAPDGSRGLILVPELLLPESAEDNGETGSGPTASVLIITRLGGSAATRGHSTALPSR